MKDSNDKNQPLKEFILSVRLNKIEILDDKDSFLQGAGEIAFLTQVIPNKNQELTKQIRLPEAGCYKMSEGTQVFDREIFRGYIDRNSNLDIKISGFESDLIKDDEFTRFEKAFEGDVQKWIGDYTPEDEVNDKENMKDWKIWYSIDVVTNPLFVQDTNSKEYRRHKFFKDLNSDSDGNIPQDVWFKGLQDKKNVFAPTVLDDDPGGEVPDNEVGIEVVGLDNYSIKNIENPIPLSGFSTVNKFFKVTEIPVDELSTLKITFQAEQIKRINKSSLKLFKFSEASESYHLISRSGMSSDGNYMYAKIHEPGIYGVFGLPRDQASMTVLEMKMDLQKILPLFDGLPNQDFFNPQICERILCNSSDIVRNRLEDPIELEKLGFGDELGNRFSVYEGQEIPRNEKGKPIGQPEGYRPIFDNDPLQNDFIRPRGGVCDYCHGGGGDLNIGKDPVVILGEGTRSACNSHWKFMGATNLSGRVKSLVSHPRGGNIYYAGVAGGGVWKSTDGGKSWKPTMSQELSLTIGSIGISKSNPDILYAATGEYLPRGYGAGSSYGGVGVYRSENGGRSWELLPMNGFSNPRCSKVLVHPTNPNLAFVAGNMGIHRWDGNIKTWTRILPDDTSDIVFDPVNDNSIVAAVQSSIGIKKTNDASTSNVIWNNFNNGLVINGGFPVTVFETPLIKLAYSISNPTLLYASVNNYNRKDGELENDALNIFRWDGSNWNFRSTIPTNSQEVWCHFISVHPRDENYVMAGGVWAYLSKDGFLSSKAKHPGHADCHSLVFNPANPSISLLATDGGVYRHVENPANEATVFTESYKDLGVLQFYNVSVSKNGPRIIGGSTQDMGILKSDDGKFYYALGGNEGGLFEIDPSDHQTIYWDPWDGNLMQTVDGGTTTRPAINGFENDGKGNYTALAIDPSNSNNLIKENSPRLCLGCTRYYCKMLAL